MTPRVCGAPHLSLPLAVLPSQVINFFLKLVTAQAAKQVLLSATALLLCVCFLNKVVVVVPSSPNPNEWPLAQQ